MQMKLCCKVTCQHPSAGQQHSLPSPSLLLYLLAHASFCYGTYTPVCTLIGEENAPCINESKEVAPALPSIQPLPSLGPEKNWGFPIFGRHLRRGPGPHRRAPGRDAFSCSLKSGTGWLCPLLWARLQRKDVALIIKCFEEQ